MKANELFDLTGQVVAVTGAASGIGLAICEVMAANGATVIMLDVDGQAADQAAARICETGGAARAGMLDVRDEAAVAAAMDEVVTSHGRLDCVFANAGVSGGPGFSKPEGAIETTSLDLWDTCLRINLDGAFYTLRAAAGHMKRQRHGSIVVTASVAAVRASGRTGYGYNAAKAAIAQVVRVAAQELAPYNVRVNAMAPGPFVTNIANGRFLSPDGVAAFAKGVPLGRVALVQEIKGLALLLGSPASSYMTGTIIPIDGGVQA